MSPSPHVMISGEEERDKGRKRTDEEKEWGGGNEEGLEGNNEDTGGGGGDKYGLTVGPGKNLQVEQLFVMVVLCLWFCGGSCDVWQMGLWQNVEFAAFAQGGRHSFGVATF